MRSVFWIHVPNIGPIPSGAVGAVLYTVPKVIWVSGPVTAWAHPYVYVRILYVQYILPRNPIHPPLYTRTVSAPTRDTDRLGFYVEIQTIFGTVHIQYICNVLVLTFLRTFLHFYIFPFFFFLYCTVPTVSGVRTFCDFLLNTSLHTVIE